MRTVKTLLATIALVFLVALVIGVQSAEAAPLTYTMTLTPDSVTCPVIPNPPFFPLPGPCPPGTTVADGIHPPPTVGQAYVGSFTLQDGSVLATDGKNLPAVLTAFRLQLGDQVWDAFHPGLPGNVFTGFRGPVPGNPECPGGTPIFCLGAPSPGFDVTNGEITGLFGGVFGLGDVPFVDFEGMTNSPGHFLALPAFNVTVEGAMDIRRVAAPSALVLLGVGLASLASLRRRKVG
jgi:hypothetical protein